MKKRSGSDIAIVRLAIRFGISFVLFLVFVLHVAGYLPIRLLSELEHIAYDARIRLTMPGGIDRRIVIVDIDEKSQAIEGQWPWPRDRLARMIVNLFDRYHVKVVGFDMVFPEQDRMAGLLTLERLAHGPLADDASFQEEFKRLRPALDTDRIFADALRGRNVVMGFTFRQREETGGVNRVGALPEPLITKADETTRLRYLEPVGYTGNLPLLQEAARHGGFFDNPTVDEDGVFRRVPVVQKFEGDVYQSLALGVVRAVLGWPPVEFVFFSGRESLRDNLDLEWLKVGDLRIPVDEHLAVLVPYRGPPGSFPYVPAADVIAGTAPAEILEDAIVLVGTSAAGLLDLRVTPVAEVYNGVEVHANIIAGMLDGRIKDHPVYVIGVQVYLFAAIGLLLTWLFARASVVTATLATLATMAVVVAANLAVWEYANFVVPLAPALTFTALLFVLHMLYGFFIESRSKRQLSQLFGQYVPPELVEEMDRNPAGFTMEGESREMTVLFSDVRDFTSIAEGLAPKELTTMMNAFLTPLTRAIHQYRGTIDKYMGDAIMAFWGAPLPDPDHGRHAVLAALDMVKIIHDLGPEFEKRGWPRLRVGIGVHTGVMSVGNMGSEFRTAYTVMGDAVNLGSRLEGLTKTYRVEIIVSEATREQAPDVQFLELDRVRVKGKEKPVAIFTPLGLRAELGPEIKSLVGRHKQALLYYRQQQWDAAEREFFSLQQSTGRAFYGIYLERIAWYRQHPPGPDWDGVFVHKTK